MFPGISQVTTLLFLITIMLITVITAQKKGGQGKFVLIIYKLTTGRSGNVLLQWMKKTLIVMARLQLCGCREVNNNKDHNHAHTNAHLQPQNVISGSLQRQQQCKSMYAFVCAQKHI